jgi:hypothetical protein
MIPYRHVRYLFPYRYVRYAFTLARPSTWIGLALQLDDATNNHALLQ